MCNMTHSRSACPEIKFQSEPFRSKYTLFHASVKPEDDGTSFISLALLGRKLGIIENDFGQYRLLLYQCNVFWGDQRSERDSWHCTCEIVTVYLQLTCARHPANRSLTVYLPNLSAIGPSVPEIWNRHPARAHVQGRVVDPNLLYHATLLTGLFQHTKFERDRSSRSRDLCRTVTLHVRACKVNPNLLYHATLLTGPYQYSKFERDWSSCSRDLKHRDLEHSSSIIQLNLAWWCFLSNYFGKFLNYSGIMTTTHFEFEKLVGQSEPPLFIFPVKATFFQKHSLRFLGHLLVSTKSVLAYRIFWFFFSNRRWVRLLVVHFTPYRDRTKPKCISLWLCDGGMDADIA